MRRLMARDCIYGSLVPDLTWTADNSRLESLTDVEK